MDYELVIRNATVIDGTRSPRYEADIFIAGGRIAAVGHLENARADAEIDASGRIAAPGFIDSHTHDDRLMLSTPDMAPKVSQGVTTVIAGNCGCSPSGTASTSRTGAMKATTSSCRSKRRFASAARSACPW